MQPLMKNVHALFHFPVTLLPLAMTLILTMTCLVFFQQSLEELLRYDRTAILSGEIWRLVTAHFLHLGWSHLLLNLAGFALLLAFFGGLLPARHWIICILLCSIGTSICLVIWTPDVEWYVGFSGVLHSLFIIGGMLDVKVRKWEGIAFLVLIIGKLSWEQIAGPLPGSEQAAGGPVLVDAHFFGAICGFICGAVLIGLQKKTREVVR